MLLVCSQLNKNLFGKRSKMESTSTQSSTSASKQCDICLLSKQDEFMFGELMTKQNLNVHYFCLLSGRDIPQRGADKVGILGFKKNDIVNSYEKYRQLVCHYCGLKSAAIHCSFPECNKTWHYPCGVENNCLTEFIGPFKSYCDLHVPDLSERREPEKNATCKACYEPLGPFSPANCIISSCCLKLFDDWPKSFLHKECIVKYCKNAGYDSMCLTCPLADGRTKEDWQDEMRSKGVYIPMEEAAWERDGRFKDQVKNKCEALNCNSITKDVYTCFVCGCFPRHLRCAKVTQHKDYYCPKCYDQSFVQRVPV